MADNPLAFPSGWPDHDIEPVGGMFLRDWFAGRAMASMLTGVVTDSGAYARGDCNAVIVQRAYVIADAMLAERERT